LFLKLRKPASDNGFADKGFDEKGKRRVTIARKKGNATFFFMVARNSITLPIMCPYLVVASVHMPCTQTILFDYAWIRCCLSKRSGLVRLYSVAETCPPLADPVSAGQQGASFWLGGIFGIYPFIPSAFKNINICIAFVHHFPCQPDTGVLIGSRSVEHDRLCFGISVIPVVEFVRIFLNGTFDFDTAFVPILRPPNI